MHIEQVTAIGTKRYIGTSGMFTSEKAIARGDENILTFATREEADRFLVGHKFRPVPAVIETVLVTETERINLIDTTPDDTSTDEED